MITTAIFLLLIVLTATTLCLAVQKYWDRQTAKEQVKASHEEREQIKSLRIEVVDLTRACGMILSSIKSRTILLDRKEDQKVEKVEAAASEMKAAVQSIVDKTAHKVVTAIEGKLDRSDASGLIATVQPNPPNPPETPQSGRCG